MNSKKLTEIKPYYVLPILFAGAILVNLGVSRPLTFGLTGFSSISLHANATADYSRDPLDLIFPVLRPDIMMDALQDQNGSGELIDSNAQATPAPPGATPTPTPALIDPLPTNDLTDPILTAADPIVATATAIIDGLVGTSGELLDPVTDPLLCLLSPCP